MVNETGRLPDSAPGKKGQLLIFKLGKEYYGIDIFLVQEIRQYQSATSISDFPDFIKGLIKVNETDVLLLDLRILFNISPVSYNTLTVMIIIKIENHIFGVVADEVIDAISYTEDQLLPAEELTRIIPQHYIKGLLNNKDEILMILDIQQLFASEILQLKHGAQRHLSE